MQLFTAVSSFALSVVAVQATPLNVYNKCGESIELYDNSATETIASGGSTTRTLADGFNGMFRNGDIAQATLAEFSITGGKTWYDISIIPTGSTGPGSCTSLENCKQVTGGTGFNTAIEIAPTGCATVTCAADGCADAFQFPSDDGKTHSCADTATINLTFCPGETAVTTTSAPATAAPTTATPTTATPTTAAPTATPQTAAPTTAPQTAAPTTAPQTAAPTTATPARTTAARTTAARTTAAPITATPTSSPSTAASTTEAPTPEPTTATPTPEPSTNTPELTTETPASVVVSSASPSFVGSYNSSSSASLNKISTEAAHGATIAVSPETESTPTSTAESTTSSSSGSSKTISTKSESSSTSVSTILMSICGAMVIVGALAAVVIAQRKKQQLEAMEPKESVYSYVGVLTPRSDIDVLNA